MKVWIRTPYSTKRNLGKAYNEEMAMIPDGDTAVFIDGDLMFCTPDYGQILHDYANTYPEAVLTSWTNRIHQLAHGQLSAENSSDVLECLKFARLQSGIHTEVTQIYGPVSGFLLVIPKWVWQLHPFAETNTYRPNEPNLLGCDNEWTNRIRKNGIPILRMDRMFVYHQYRLLTGTKDHLL
jgi:hypothetical protein